MVLFDRSWYNRAGVERVMGFCNDIEYQEFLRSCPEFERMLVRSGILVIKYWFSVSDAEQERRFQSRMNDRTRSWKLSPMDVESRSRWVEYSRAKDTMFAHTDIKQAPWYVVKADNKKLARLNCITHLLSMVEYGDLTPTPPNLPPRPKADDYVRPPLERSDLRAGLLVEGDRRRGGHSKSRRQCPVSLGRQQHVGGELLHRRAARRARTGPELHQNLKAERQGNGAVEALGLRRRYSGSRPGSNRAGRKSRTNRAARSGTARCA